MKIPTTKAYDDLQAGDVLPSTDGSRLVLHSKARRPDGLAVLRFTDGSNVLADTRLMLVVET